MRGGTRWESVPWSPRCSGSSSERNSLWLLSDFEFSMNPPRSFEKPFSIILKATSAPPQEVPISNRADRGLLIHGPCDLIIDSEWHPTESGSAKVYHLQGIFLSLVYPLT